MLKRLIIAASILLIAACASSPPASQTSSQAAPAPAAAPVVVNSTKGYSTIAVVVKAAAGSDVDADNLDTVRKNLTDSIMTNLAAESNLRAAAAGVQADLLVTVEVKDLHYVSVTKRVMLGMMAGHSSLSADITLQDQKSNATLWSNSIDTTASIWSGYYGSSSASQLDGLARTIADAVKQKI